MYNDCTFIGNLGKDPETRTSKDKGKSFTTFSIAVNKPGASKDEKPLWLNVTTFNSTADFASQYLKAGNRVLVQGSIELQEYEKDGVNRQSLKLIANKLVSLTPKEGNGASAPAAQAKAAPAKAVADDDIPF